MKKLIAVIFLFGLAAGAASAQTTAVTATITDGNSQVWAACQWTARVISPNGYPSINGVRVAESSLSANGACNSSGVISATIARTSSFDQAAACWQFTIAPNASSSPYSPSCQATTGSSQNLSTQLSTGIITPSFFGGTPQTAYGYADNEVITVAGIPSSYYNTINSVVRQFNGFSWTGAGGTSGVASINGTAGPFTFTGSGVSCTSVTCTFSGGGAVSSVFTRTGAVTAQSGDYSFSQISGSVVLSSQVSGLLPIANGGTGTATPGIVAGSNITITGTWPNQTINSTGGGSSGISGQTAGFVPLAGSATTLTSSAPLDYNITNTGQITATKPLVIVDSVDPNFVGFAPNGVAPAVQSGQAGWGLGATLSTAGYYKMPDAPGTGVWHASNSSGIVTDTISAVTLSDISATLPLSCQPGVGDGLNSIPAGTYLQTTCRNETGRTWTITAIRCVSDNSGTSTCNATNGAGTGLLTGAITATPTYANGTQSGTTTIASGDYLKITFIADGTSTQIGIDVAGTY